MNCIVLRTSLKLYTLFQISSTSPFRFGLYFIALCDYASRTSKKRSFARSGNLAVSAPVTYECWVQVQVICYTRFLLSHISRFGSRLECNGFAWATNFLLICGVVSVAVSVLSVSSGGVWSIFMTCNLVVMTWTVVRYQSH